MELIGISINHKTAPVHLREELHLTKEEMIDLAAHLKKDLLSEGIVLSTCNRTEIFGLTQNKQLNHSQIIQSLIDLKKSNEITEDHFYKFFSCNAVKHLFNVAAGIDSLILGDSQILGQVKEAFQLSEDVRFSGAIMRRISEYAIHVGKRAISETSIGVGAVTVSYAAVQVIEKIFAGLNKKSALIIGAGETAELAAIHLKDKGIGKISITNRSFDRGKILAEKINGYMLNWDNFKNELHNFDIIISATSSPELIIYYDEIKKVMKKRKGSPLFIMDIAVPRDIDPKVKKLDNVFHNDIDSLKVIVNENLKKRENEIPVVKKIIQEELVNFFSWYNTLEVVPTIKTVREFFEMIGNDELVKIKNKIHKDDYPKIEQMTKRLIGRILHNPTINLRKLAESGRTKSEAIEYSEILKELFNLTKNSNNGKDTN